jgi:hypothetical protein
MAGLIRKTQGGKNMIFFGCLFVFVLAFAPRLVLILAWIFSVRWDTVWSGQWLIPILGIVFAPYTTVMYMLSWNSVTGISGWDWIWIALGVMLDIMKWSSTINSRKKVPGYPQDEPASPQPVAPAQYQQPSAPATPAAADVPAEDELARLAKLRDEGLLTDEEYQAKKDQLEG